MYIIRVSCVARGSSNAAFVRDQAFYALSDDPHDPSSNSMENGKKEATRDEPFPAGNGNFGINDDTVYLFAVTVLELFCDYRVYEPSTFPAIFIYLFIMGKYHKYFWISDDKRDACQEQVMAFKYL